MARTKTGEKKKREESLRRQEDNEFEIEKVVKAKGSGKGLQYMVKWKGYPESDNTWESPSDLPKSVVSAFLKKSSPKKSSPKKEVKKEAKKEPKTLVVTDRLMNNNVVHYKVEGKTKPIPIYSFDDMEPVYEFERNAVRLTDDHQKFGPLQILDKKGSKYHVLWRGVEQKKTWETSKNLVCVPLMKAFDDKQEEEEFKVNYDVEKVVGKRKVGRGYEFEVEWRGVDTTTWEAEATLKGRWGSKINAFLKAEERRNTAKAASKRSKSPKKSSPVKRARSNK